MGKIYYKTPLIQPIQDKDINGIFDFFLNKSIDPTTTFLDIKTNGNWPNTDPWLIIKWKYQSAKWASINQLNSYLAFSFSPNILKLTHFSFKGYIGYGFAMKFDLYGLKHFDDWVKIESFDSKDYCGTKKNEYNKNVCANDNVEIWKLSKPAFYAGYKWSVTEGCDEPGVADHLSMQGIDLFGQFNPIICSKSKKLSMNFSIITSFLFVFLN